MSWKQLKSPNLNVSAQLGMCLQYVQNAFGSGWAGEYALQGWSEINKLNHADRNVPAGVYVPIWFSGYWAGFNYGHVAIYKDGIVYSSPYTDKNSHDQLGNIATVEKVYGMKYVGWSEDIGGTRVIEEEEQMTAEELQKHNLGVAFSKLKRLSEGTLLVRAKLPKTNVWRLDTEPDWKSSFAYKRGDEFEVVAYVDTNGTRYYVSAPDALNGKPWGVNRNDVEIVGPVKPSDADKKLAQIKKIVG